MEDALAAGDTRMVINFAEVPMMIPAALVFW